jgi:hypothetical protein
MNIEYFEPLSRAWDRMKKALFQPFDLQKWFAVGFTAFLAGLTEWQGGGSHRWGGRAGTWKEFFRFPAEAREWLLDHPLWASLILGAAVLLLVLAVFLIWLSSRGKFMFLDNVAHDRSRVKAPWREFGKLGDSLFVWRLALGAAGFVVFGAYLAFCFMSLYGRYESGLPDRMLVMNAIAMGLGLFVLIVAFGYLSYFLNEFVSAVMYKRNLAALPAIGRFWDAFKAHPAPFLAYGIIVFILQILVACLVILAGVFTCCIGFILLAIPYVSSVVLLPVSYTLRAFSLEFLAQFGPDYNVFTSRTRTSRTEGKRPAKTRKPARRAKR